MAGLHRGSQDVIGFRFEGFHDVELNGEYFARDGFPINGRQTYWKENSEWFMYFYKGQSRWQIVPRTDPETNDDSFTVAEQGGKKGLAFSKESLDPPLWMQLVDGQWQEVRPRVVSLYLPADRAQQAPSDIQLHLCLEANRRAAEQRALQQAREQAAETARSQAAIADQRIRTRGADELVELRRQIEQGLRAPAPAADISQAGVGYGALSARRPTLPPPSPLLGALSASSSSLSSGDRSSSGNLLLGGSLLASGNPLLAGAQAAVVAQPGAEAPQKVRLRFAGAAQEPPPAQGQVERSLAFLDSSEAAPSGQKVLTYAHVQHDRERERATESAAAVAPIVGEIPSAQVSPVVGSKEREMALERAAGMAVAPVIVWQSAPPAPASRVLVPQTPLPPGRSREPVILPPTPEPPAYSPQTPALPPPPPPTTRLSQAAHAAPAREEAPTRFLPRTPVEILEGGPRTPPDAAPPSPPVQRLVLPEFREKPARSSEGREQSASGWADSRGGDSWRHGSYSWRTGGHGSDRDADDWRQEQSWQSWEGSSCDRGERATWQSSWWNSRARAALFGSWQEDWKDWSWKQSCPADKEPDGDLAGSRRDARQAPRASGSGQSPGAAELPARERDGGRRDLRQAPRASSSSQGQGAAEPPAKEPDGGLACGRGYVRQAPRASGSSQASGAAEPPAKEPDGGLAGGRRDTCQVPHASGSSQGPGAVEPPVKAAPVADAAKREKKDKKDKKEKKDKRLRRVAEGRRKRELLLDAAESKRLKVLGFPATVDGFFLFMRERESIRIRRSRGKPPWTDDELLQCIRVSNVKREHDRTGQLIQRLLSREVARWRELNDGECRDRLTAGIVLSVALWRHFGSVDFIVRLGFIEAPQTETEVNDVVVRVLETAVSAWREGLHACTDAYAPAKYCWALELSAWLQANVKEAGSDAQLTRQALAGVLQGKENSGDHLRNIKPIREGLVSQGGEASMRRFYDACLNYVGQIRDMCQQAGVVARALRCGSSDQTWRASSEALGAVTGYGHQQGAHAAEIMRDLLPTPLLAGCTDVDSWAPVDDAARRCLNRLNGRSPSATPSAEQLQSELLEVFRSRRQLWPGAIAGAPSVELRLPDVRAQLAEFERYLRVQEEARV